MRRILIERARHKASQKCGGGQRRLNLGELSIPDTADESHDELLALDEALSELERHDPPAATLVKLRYFAGLPHQEEAAALGIGRAPPTFRLAAITGHMRVLHRTGRERGRNSQSTSRRILSGHRAVLPRLADHTCRLDLAGIAQI